MKALVQHSIFSNTKKLTIRLLIACVLLQLGVLGSQLVSAAYPHWTGKTINVATIPVDPRSLFRGNYARLRYSFSVLSAEQLGISEDVLGRQRIGEPVYTVLKLQADSLYAFNRAQLSPPEGLADDEVVLRGRFSSKFWRGGKQRRVDYGINAYFAPKAKALALEKELRDSGVATLKVTASGKVALVDVSGAAKQ